MSWAPKLPFIASLITLMIAYKNLGAAPSGLQRYSSNKKLVRVNKNLAEELDKDISQLQWMVSSETEFCLVYDLVEKKYRSGIFTEVENEILEQFWHYHRSQWGPKSNVCYWYEAAHPFTRTNNQGLESKNKKDKI